MAAVSASVYSADLSSLRMSAEQAQRDGAEGLHVDVIDGHFTFGFGFPAPFVRCLKACSQLPVDVHLQIENPERYLDSFIEAGADNIVFHIEAARMQTAYLLKKIKDAGVQGGVALCPDTDPACLKKYLPLCDNVLLLGVHPGDTGEDFLPSTIGRIREVRRMAEEQGVKTGIYVDGKIQRESGIACLQAGADTLVIGKAFFQGNDRAGLMHALKNAV